MSFCNWLFCSLALFLLALDGSAAENIWSPFMNEGNTIEQHNHQQQAPAPESDLRSSLMVTMERVHKGTPDTCQPSAGRDGVPDSASGNDGKYYRFLIT